MKKSPFVSLIFKGARFGEASMPLETLPELAAYRELVLEAAKALFQARNPTRKRLPRGFENGLHLVLEKVIEGGSAIPQISRVDERDLALLDVPREDDIFELARDLIQNGIAAGGMAPDVLPPDLAKQVLARFGSFGRTLGPDESIVVGLPGTRNGAIYNRALRKKLVLQAQPLYEDEIDLVGDVRAADRDSEGFDLRTLEGIKYRVRVPEMFFPIALRSLSTSVPVRVRGTGLFDETGSLRRIEMATDVSIAEEDLAGDRRRGCSTPIEQQVHSLSILPAGWFDESSPSYQQGQLDWMLNLLKGILEGFNLPVPYLYPTPEGTARAEWPGSKWEVVANVGLVEHVADVMAVRLDSDRIEEDKFSLNLPGSESKLGRFLVEHLEVS